MAREKFGGSPPLGGGVILIFGRKKKMFSELSEMARTLIKKFDFFVAPHNDVDEDVNNVDDDVNSFLGGI
jgi:hypothetical protein